MIVVKAAKESVGVGKAQMFTVLAVREYLEQKVIAIEPAPLPCQPQVELTLTTALALDGVPFGSKGALQICHEASTP